MKDVKRKTYLTSLRQIGNHGSYSSTQIGRLMGKEEGKGIDLLDFGRNAALFEVCMMAHNAVNQI